MKYTIFLITLIFLNFNNYTYASDHQHSIIFEYNFYSADRIIDPAIAFSYRFITEKHLGIQFSYSKLPYYYSDYPWSFRDRISWWSLLIVRPLSFTLNNFKIELSPGLGALYQKTWHDDLEYEQTSPGCFGCGDYYTANRYYLSLQIGAEVKRSIISKNFQIGVGGIFRKYLGMRIMATDTHNPPFLNYSYGIVISANYSFNLQKFANNLLNRTPKAVA